MQYVSLQGGTKLEVKRFSVVNGKIRTIQIRFDDDVKYFVNI